MPSSSSSNAQQARQALADQLREIRLAAGLTGRALAAGAGWLRADRDTASMQAAAQTQRAAQDQIKVLTAATSAPYRPVTLASPWREGQATADLTQLTSQWGTRQSDAISLLQEEDDPMSLGSLQRYLQMGRPVN